MGLAMAETVSARLANVPGLQVVTPRRLGRRAPSRDSNFAQRRAAARRQHAALRARLQRENDRFRITYRLARRERGRSSPRPQSTAPSCSLCRTASPTASSRDLRLRRGPRRTPTPSGLDTPADAGALPPGASASCSATTGADRVAKAPRRSSRRSPRRSPTRPSCRPRSPAPTSRCSTSRRTARGPIAPSPPPTRPARRSRPARRWTLRSAKRCS